MYCYICIVIYVLLCVGIVAVHLYMLSCVGRCNRVLFGIVMYRYVLICVLMYCYVFAAMCLLCIVM